MKSKAMFAALIASLVAGAYLPMDASAATLRVKCEKRSDRSKISVDGKSLVPGSYRCRAVSGNNQKTTSLRVTVGTELECDFDSNPADVRAGATAITSNFIQGGLVTGKILDAAGDTVISDTVRCKTN